MKAAAIVTAACLTAGCAGELADPERFQGAASEPACELDVERDVLAGCATAGCHDDSTDAASGLALEGDGFAEALVDQEAEGCDGRLLVSSTDPASSYLVEKVSSSAPECGDPMPIVGQPLEAEERRCLEQWARRLGEMHARGPDAGAGTGGGP